MTRSPQNPSRHQWIWFSLPVAILLFVVSLAPLSGGMGRALPNSASLPVGLALAGFCLLVLTLGVVWAGRLGPATVFKPTVAFAFVVAPAWAGGVSTLSALPPAGVRSMGELSQWGFIIAVSMILVYGLAGSLRASRRERPARKTRVRFGPAAWRDAKELTKLNLNGLVLVTTSIGFYMAARAGFDGWLFARALIGTGLVACGSSALNQFMEKEEDARMPRTAGRPIPAGRVSPPAVMLIGVTLSIAGIAILTLTVNLHAGFLAALTLAVYLFLYTPLKRINTLSTLAGAIAGALPPVIGWAAAGGGNEPMAWTMFFVLFLWQIPHFLAIAWKYREQYGAAGFPMYAVLDPTGRATGATSVAYVVALVPVSLMPVLLGATGVLYALCAAILGLGLLWLAYRLYARPTRERATGLFLASIAYLPILLVLMIADKAPLPPGPIL